MGIKLYFTKRTKINFIKGFFFCILLFVSQNIFPDEAIDPNLDCCIETNKSINQQIKKQEVIIQELKKINQSIGIPGDTIVCESVIYMPDYQDQEKCSFCDIIGALIGAVIGAIVAIVVFLLKERSQKNKRKIE